MASDTKKKYILLCWSYSGLALLKTHWHCSKALSFRLLGDLRLSWVLKPTQFLSMTSLVRETQSVVFKGRAKNTWRLVLLIHRYIAQAPASFSIVAVCSEESLSLKMQSYGLQKVTDMSRSIVHFKGSSPLQEKFMSQQLRGCEALVCSPDIQADEVNTIRLLKRTLITIITGAQHTPKCLVIL